MDWTPNLINSGFYDQGSGGAIQIPDRIRISDLQYNPASMGGYEGGELNAASLGFTPESRHLYGGWGMGNSLSNNYQIQYEGYDPQQGLSSGGGVAWNPDMGLSFMVKSGDKIGSRINYKRDGDYLVADPASRSQIGWNTNDTEQNAALGKLAATGLSMGTLGGAMEGIGSALNAGTMPSLSQVGTALGGVNNFTGGQIPGLSQIGGLAGGLGNIGNAITGGIDSLGDIAKLATSGYNVYNKGSQLMDMFSGPDERAGTGFQPRPSYTTNQPLVEESGGGFWGSIGDIGKAIFGGAGGGSTGLMDIYGAYRGSKEARDEAFRLQDLYNQAQARRQPVLDRLNASYTDPNTFYDSNQWKGLQSVYQNQIDRGAAKAGRLANPTDREVLLNNYAMKELENYRGGLRQQAQMLNPDNYINPFMRGSTREANAANPYYALGGRGSVGGPGMGGDTYGTLVKLAQSFGGFDKIPSFLRNMFDSSNPNYDSPAGGFESNFPTGPAVIDDTSSFDPSSFGGWSDEPFTFNPAGENGFGVGDFDVEDTSWIDDLFGGF